MGKLIRKLVRGIMPSWLFTGFRCTNTPSTKLLHSRLKQGIHFTSSKSSAPVLPPSSALSNTELVDLLIEMDRSVYYYSQSEDEPEQAITGNSNLIPPPSIESNSHDDDDQIHASQNPRMGAHALAAASDIRGTCHDDKLKPTSPHNGFKSSMLPASINLQSHHDHDGNLHSHPPEECQHHGCSHHSWQHQHQHQALPDETPQQHHVGEGPAPANQYCQHFANNEPHTCQHLAGDASFWQNDDPHAHHYHYNNHCMYQHAGYVNFCQHDDAVYHYTHHNHQNNHMYKYNHDSGDGSLYMHDDAGHQYGHQYDHNNHKCENHHHVQGYGSNNLICMSQEGRPKPNIESHPISSFANSATTETQHNNDHEYQHHHQFQNDNQFYQHHASRIDYHQPYLGGLRRKSIFHFEGIDGKEDGKDEGNHHHSMIAWPCVKRQRTHEGNDVACELPECITEKVGDSCAIVQYSYQNPEFAFWESMMQMIVNNELCDSNELQFLLHCYLALNDPHLHHIIHTSFLQVLKDLQQSMYELGWIK